MKTWIYDGDLVDEEPEIEMSEKSQTVSSAGKDLSVEIYRIKGTQGWTLEIVDEFNNSTVWDDLFETDSEAIAEAKRAILEDTVGAFVGHSDGKGNDDWR